MSMHPGESDPVALAELTTLRVGGFPERLLAPGDRDSLIGVIRDVWSAGEEWLLLGGGSNTLVADEGFAGTVIRVVTRGVQRLTTAPGIVRLRIAAGEVWDEVVASAVRNGWSGIEALSGIPGSVGAAPVQNIGAYGQELASVVRAVEFLDADIDEVIWLPPEELGLGYRTSVFKQGRRGVVLSIIIDLADNPVPQGMGAPPSAPIVYEQLADALGVRVGTRVSTAEVRRMVLSLRASKGMVLDPDDPDSVSAGSFFTNPIVSESFSRTLPADAPRWSLAPHETDTLLPLGTHGVDPGVVPGFTQSRQAGVKLSAAWLIEQAGIHRGFSLPGSGAAVSTKHTLSLVNSRSATAAEIVQLASYIQYRVQADFGVTLMPEPVLVGLDL